MKEISYALIVAAVGGDTQAIEQIIQHYEPWIEELCGGDEDMRQELKLALIEAVRNFDLNEPEKNEEYLRVHYPDSLPLM